jgi:hypothetical protein
MSRFVFPVRSTRTVPHPHRHGGCPGNISVTRREMLSLFLFLESTFARSSRQRGASSRISARQRHGHSPRAAVRPDQPASATTWVGCSRPAERDKRQCAAQSSPLPPLDDTAPRSGPARRAQRNHYPPASPTPPWPSHRGQVPPVEWSGVVGMAYSAHAACLSVRPRSKGSRHIPPSWFLDFSCRGSFVPHHGPRCTDAPTTRPYCLLPASACRSRQQKKTVRCHGTTQRPGKRKPQIEDSDLPAPHRSISPPPSSVSPSQLPRGQAPARAFSSPPSAWVFHVHHRSARARDRIIAPSAEPPSPSLSPIAAPDDRTKRHRTP